MEPLSIAASVIGVTAPALHCIRRLLDDIENIVDAPEAVACLRGDLQTFDNALTSLQTISDPQWESLGPDVVNKAKAATTSCLVSCDRFRTALARWTRHSSCGRLAWQDRATVGFFKKGQMKSMSEQLQSCKGTLTAVVSIATLHSSLQQKSVSEDTMKIISAKEAEVTGALELANQQLADVNTQLAALRLASHGNDEKSHVEPDADRASIIDQIGDEQKSLDISRNLLEALLESTQAAAADAQRRADGRASVTFGNLGKGFQVATNHGTISGITFQ